jgi:hypothetical protein
MALSLKTEVSLAYKWGVTAATGGGFASQAAPPVQRRAFQPQRNLARSGKG